MHTEPRRPHNDWVYKNSTFWKLLQITEASNLTTYESYYVPSIQMEFVMFLHWLKPIVTRRNEMPKQKPQPRVEHFLDFLESPVHLDKLWWIEVFLFLWDNWTNSLCKMGIQFQYSHKSIPQSDWQYRRLDNCTSSTRNLKQ